jgi:hypothetical protein
MRNRRTLEIALEKISGDASAYDLLANLLANSKAAAISGKARFIAAKLRELEQMVEAVFSVEPAP